MADETNNNPSEKECWHRIGVWGNASPRCPKLKAVIHCHNCDVFHAASLRVYERPLDDAYRDEWTTVLGGDKEARSAASLTVIVFRLGEEWVALPTTYCKEITKMLSIHRLPHNRSTLLRGVVNTGGEVQLCVSLGNVIGVQKVEAVTDSERHSIYGRMIVAENHGKRFVFPVSEIGGIYHCRPNEFEPVPKTVADSTVSYMRGIISWNGKHVGCIDGDLLFSAMDRGIRV